MLRLVTLTLITCLALPAGTAAQIPNPLRRAKAKAAQVLTGQQPAQSGAPKFDDVVLELTPQLVNQVIAGLKVRARAKSSEGLNSVELRRRATELADEQTRLNQGREADRTAFENKLNEAQGCVGEVLTGMGRQQYEAMQRRFLGMTGANLAGDQSANAKFMREFQEVGMELSAAGAAGDTARIRKAEAAYNKLMGIDPKADSAKARAQCNYPTAPAWLARADTAGEQSNRFWDKARALEQSTTDTAVKVSGLGAEQFAMAVERIAAFAGATTGSYGIWKFTRSEESALTARLAELKTLI